MRLRRTLVPVAVDIFDAGDVLVAIARVTYLRLRSPDRPSR